MPTMLAEVVRGPVVECQHFGAVAVVDAEGKVIASAGDAEVVAFLRSAAKPFQMLPLVERGHADRLGLGDDHLAVIAASHVGGAEHVRLVAEILDRIGLTASALECGYHEPMDPESRHALRADPARESPIRTSGAEAWRSSCSTSPMASATLAE